MDTAEHWDARYAVISFPKSGRTWVKLIMDIYRTLDPEFPQIKFTHDILSGDFQDIVPFYNLRKLYNTEKIRDRRNLLYSGKKVALLVRDPRDVVVSYYFQKKYREPELVRQGQYPYLAREIKGGIGKFVRNEFYGIRQVAAFMNLFAEDIRRGRLGVITYEGLKRDRLSEIKRLLKWFRIDTDQRILKAAVEKTDFGTMRDLELNLLATRGHDNVNAKTLKTRRGIVGSHKDELPRMARWFVNRHISKTLSPVFSSYTGG